MKTLLLLVATFYLCACAHTDANQSRKPAAEAHCFARFIPYVCTGGGYRVSVQPIDCYHKSVTADIFQGDTKIASVSDVSDALEGQTESGLARWIVYSGTDFKLKVSNVAQRSDDIDHGSEFQFKVADKQINLHDLSCPRHARSLMELEEDYNFPK